MPVPSRRTRRWVACERRAIILHRFDVFDLGRRFWNWSKKKRLICFTSLGSLAMEVPTSRDTTPHHLEKSTVYPLISTRMSLM